MAYPRLRARTQVRAPHAEENQEKLKSPTLVVGKYGVGLKDALATFDRKLIGVLIKSQYGDITLGKSTKHGFRDITTLHAIIDQPSNPSMIGTEFILTGVTDKDVAAARDFFLKFSGDQVLETTAFGQVLKKHGGTARIYITGLRIAEEENFLFSYNITAITKNIRKALNRERMNVGRNAYRDRVMDMLLACKQEHVGEVLVDDLEQFEQGTMHDELTWIDVQVHACKLLNATKRVIFLTPAGLRYAKDMVAHATNDGYTIITVPEIVKEKISGLTDVAGQPIRDLAAYAEEWNKSFVFTFVNTEDLTSREREIFSQTQVIFGLIGGRPSIIDDILISETMRTTTFSSNEANGIWEPEKRLIVIKRNQLKNLQAYAGTLLHETAHALSGAVDVSEAFEAALTELLGKLASKTL